MSEVKTGLVLEGGAMRGIFSADEVTDILMGSNVPPRRQFIMDEAKYANLDI